MADEIQLTVGLTVTKGELTESDEPGVQEIDMAGERYSAGVMDVGSGAHEQIPLGSDFGTVGWGWLANLDATDSIDVGRDSGGTFVPLLTVPAATKYPVRFASNAIYVKGSANTPKLKYKIYEA